MRLGARAAALLGLVCALGARARTARATAPGLFGYGPRSTALAQSDIAAAQPSSAAFTNPAFACEPGTRLTYGYGHGWTHLTLDSHAIPYSDIAGTDLAMQAGWALGDRWRVGGGIAAHVPDRSLARISFRPGSEPAFVRFDPSSYRATFDLALSLRFDALSVGAGASVLAGARGEVRFLLGQDGNGTYADGDTSVTLPYDVAPTVGASVDLRSASVALRYRGAQSIELALATRADVAVSGNPLNGTTTVNVTGQSGYEPATWDLGARWDPIAGVRVHGALQLARWSEAPPAAADLSLDVRLGLTPGQWLARFVRPALRDTLSPRIGLLLEPEALQRRLALRAGYAYSPSPVPAQASLATGADAPAHIVAAGAGLDLGRVWGVALRSDAALQWWMLRDRTFDKPSEVLPFAHYRAGGRLIDASLALEATWR